MRTLRGYPAAIRRVLVLTGALCVFAGSSAAPASAQLGLPTAPPAPTASETIPQAPAELATTTQPATSQSASPVGEVLQHPTGQLVAGSSQDKTAATQEAAAAEPPASTSAPIVQSVVETTASAPEPVSVVGESTASVTEPVLEAAQGIVSGPASAEPTEAVDAVVSNAQETIDTLATPAVAPGLVDALVTSVTESANPVAETVSPVLDVVAPSLEETRALATTTTRQATTEIASTGAGTATFSSATQAVPSLIRPDVTTPPVVAEADPLTPPGVSSVDEEQTLNTPLEVTHAGPELEGSPVADAAARQPRVVATSMPSLPSALAALPSGLVLVTDKGTSANGGTSAARSSSSQRPLTPGGGPLSALASAVASAAAGALVIFFAALAAALSLAAPGLGRRLRPTLAPRPLPIAQLSLERPG